VGTAHGPAGTLAARLIATKREQLIGDWACWVGQIAHLTGGRFERSK